MVARIVTQAYRLFGGCSHSLVPRPVFRGYWFDAEHEKLYRDEVSQLVVDVQKSMREASFLVTLSTFRAYARDQYAKVGSPQLEIWLILHPIDRIGE